MAAVEIDARDEGDVRILKITGALDALNATQLNQVLRDAIGMGHSKIICDFVGVSYVCSAVIGALFSKNKQARDANGGIVLAGPSVEVRTIFDSMEMAAVFTITETVAEALEAFA